MGPNQTCRFLSNGYRFELTENNRVRCTPCCKWDHVQSVELGQPAVAYRSFRGKIGLVNSATFPGCNLCNKLVEQGVPDSMRQSSFNDIPADSNFGDPTFLELQLDRTCNGGCIICGPQYSSFWQQELRNAGHITIEPVKQDLLGQILDVIDVQKTRKINFLGGESFLTDEDSRLLQIIKNPELVTLQYSTNGSVYPTKKRQALWANFKKVYITFSIDGVGDRFDYIRYPLKWQTVVDNFARMRDQLPSNTVFSVCHTVNIFNLYYYNEIKQWYDTQGISSQQLIYNPAYGLLSPHSVTEKLKNKILDKYGPDHKVTRTISNTDLDTRMLFDFMNTLDARRNLNWKFVFPEISDCF